MSILDLCCTSPRRIAAVAAAFCFVAADAVAADPVDVESSSWTTTGPLKAKVDGEKDETEVEVTLEFGPGDELDSNGFRMIVDDGVEPIEIAGSYTESDGKLKLSATDEAILDALDVDFDPQDEDLSLKLKYKLKAKVKMKDGVETLKLRFKMKARVDDAFFGDSESARFRYKGEGTRDIIE